MPTAGDGDGLAEVLALTLLEGETDAEGDVDALRELLGLWDRETLLEGDVDADGDWDADGELLGD